MLQRTFPGAEEFVRTVDAAVRAGGEREVTDALRGALCRMIREQRVRLPDCVYEPHGDRYARRELYRSEHTLIDRLEPKVRIEERDLRDEVARLWKDINLCATISSALTRVLCRRL